MCLFVSLVFGRDRSLLHQRTFNASIWYTLHSYLCTYIYIYTGAYTHTSMHNVMLPELGGDRGTLMPLSSAFAEFPNRQLDKHAFFLPAVIAPGGLCFRGPTEPLSS